MAVFAAWFLSNLLPSRPVNGFDIGGYGKLPVLLEGRIQPLDSMARNALLSMRGKSTLRTGSNTLSATEWLLETASIPELADQRKIFRVSHPDLEGLMIGNCFCQNARFFPMNTSQKRDSLSCIPIETASHKGVPYHSSGNPSSYNA